MLPAPALPGTAAKLPASCPPRQRAASGPAWAVETAAKAAKQAAAARRRVGTGQTYLGVPARSNRARRSPIRGSARTIYVQQPATRQRHAEAAATDPGGLA